ncbi:MAG: hypothetical protein LBH45_06980, partial [Campylobacteraceae bacterium]|nr:hypothetical protein [Campylobacteraceae bacterium]
MFNSLSKIGALGFSKRKTLSLFLPLLAILFLIGCGGGGSSKTYHDVSFYDSNLDLVATKTVEEGHINPSELLSGSWYKAGENSQVTDHNLVDDTN